VFLGYSPHHKGYICFDRHTNHTIISRHVIFDETSFPFSTDPSPPSNEAFDFLEDYSNPVTVPFPPSPFFPLQVLLLHRCVGLRSPAHPRDFLLWLPQGPTQPLRLLGPHHLLG
jgi:hypothetical protein